MTRSCGLVQGGPAESGEEEGGGREGGREGEREEGVRWAREDPEYLFLLGLPEDKGQHANCPLPTF